MTSPKSKEVEVLGAERRRRWAASEKLAMVRETYEPGMTVSLVARQHGVNPNQLFHWRKLERIGALTAVGLARRWCRRPSWRRPDDRFGSCSDCSARRPWKPRSCARRWR